MKMVQVDLQKLFLFNDRDGQFSRKKAASSTKSRIPISKRHDTGLAARVSMAARRDGDTAALSDSGWSSIDTAAINYATRMHARTVSIEYSFSRSM